MSHFILDNCIYFNSTQFFFFYYCTIGCTVRDAVIDPSYFQKRITFIIYNDTTFMRCVHVLFDTNFYLSFKVKTTTETLVSPSQKAS